MNEIEKIPELNEKDTINALKEMVEYIIDIEDKEIIDSYANTFMFISKGYAKKLCKNQRHLCCKNWRENKDKYPQLQSKSIFNAPQPSELK